MSSKHFGQLQICGIDHQKCDDYFTATQNGKNPKT